MAESADLPPLESCGFIRVPPDPGTDPNKPLWLTCDNCSKSDHFWMDSGVIRCRCGARYTHASRPDGRSIPVAELTFVPFDKGPMSLADTEIDPIRLTLAIVVIVSVLGGIGWLVWWLVSGGMAG